MAPKNALLHGTLEVLILKTVSQAPRHGYAVARLLEEHSGSHPDTLRGSCWLPFRRTL